MRKLSILFLSLTISLFMISCGGTECRLDNPTDKEIKVTIDGKETITLAPGEYTPIYKISLSEGEHTMKVDDKDEISFTVSGSVGMLNPTLSTYVFAKQEYSVTGMSNTLQDEEIELDEKVYKGPFEKTNEAFIPTGDMNFGIDQPFKNEITTSKSGVVIMKKLFRKKDFTDYYKKEYR